MVSTLFTTVILGMILLEDLKYRAVGWYWLVLVLGGLLYFYHWQINVDQQLRFAVFNLSFLGIQALLVWLYFQFKKVSTQEIFAKYIGLGDWLFFIVLAIALPSTMFLLVYVVGLIVALFLGLSLFKRSTIPLAGILAAFLWILMLLDQLKVLNLSNTIL